MDSAIGARHYLLIAQLPGQELDIALHSVLGYQNLIKQWGGTYTNSYGYL